MAREKAFTIQHTIYMTPDMWNHLQQLARKRERDCNENVLIREAVRLYLDNQTEVLGSRRHFQKSFQERIDQLENNLTQIADRDSQLSVFYAHVIVRLLALGLAHVIAHLTHKEITPQQLIQKAVIDARREERVLAEQVYSIHEMAAPDQP